MKRRRISPVTKEVSHIECSSPLFSDLPRDILVNILVKLPVKTICLFKCVCKTSHDIVSDPEFAKLHFDQSDVYPLIRTLYYKRYRSKSVHLVHPITFSNKPGSCVSNNVPRLEIPIRFRLPKYHDEYDIVTCNGLLFLFKSFYEHQYFPIVCNPVTGEYINLPRSKKIDSGRQRMLYGFGFSPATNQYKVLRMCDGGTGTYANKVEVHILGTKTWKDIGFFSEPMPHNYPTYFNGFLYWSPKPNKLDLHDPLSILTFDIEKERFGSVSAPENCIGTLLYDMSVSLEVLGGELCIFGSSYKYDTIHVWAMKDYRGTDEKAALPNKVFSMDDHLLYTCPNSLKGSSFKPIKYTNDGVMLLFYRVKHVLVYMNPKEKRFRYFKVHGLDKTLSSEFEAYIGTIAYTPSFVSLKHVLPGRNVKVLNVNSRWEKSKKLHKEADNIYIEEFH